MIRLQVHQSATVTQTHNMYRNSRTVISAIHCRCTVSKRSTPRTCARKTRAKNTLPSTERNFTYSNRTLHNIDRLHTFRMAFIPFGWFGWLDFELFYFRGHSNWITSILFPVEWRWKRFNGLDTWKKSPYLCGGFCCCFVFPLSRYCYWCTYFSWQPPHIRLIRLTKKRKNNNNNCQTNETRIINDVWGERMGNIFPPLSNDQPKMNSRN